MLPRKLSWAVLLSVVTGCSVGDLDLEGKDCPCLDGWVCDDSRNVCVRLDGGAADTGGTDTGISPDSGTVTDTGTDTGPITDTGTMNDAAPADTAPADTFIPPDPTGCDDTHAGALFCDGFEGGDFSLWDGVRTPRGSTAEIVTDVVYRGTRALRTESNTGGSSGPGPEVVVFPEGEVASEQWVRAYYYVPSSTGLPVEVSQMRPTVGGYDFVHSLGTTQTNLHSHSIDPGWRAENASMGFPLDTWVCVEVHALVNDARLGVIEAYWDGVRVLESSGFDTTTTDGMNQVFAGPSWKPADETHVVYVDEFVADDSMIGCDPAP